MFFWYNRRCRINHLGDWGWWVSKPSHPLATSHWWKARFVEQLPTNCRLRECHHQSSINNDFQQLVVLKVARALIEGFVHRPGVSDGDSYTWNIWIFFRRSWQVGHCEFFCKFCLIRNYIGDPILSERREVIVFWYDMWYFRCVWGWWIERCCDHDWDNCFVLLLWQYCLRHYWVVWLARI